jgi:hypothetical protein
MGGDAYGENETQPLTPSEQTTLSTTLDSFHKIIGTKAAEKYYVTGSVAYHRFLSCHDPSFREAWRLHDIDVMVEQKSIQDFVKETKTACESVKGRYHVVSFKDYDDAKIQGEPRFQFVNKFVQCKATCQLSTTPSANPLPTGFITKWNFKLLRRSTTMKSYLNEAAIPVAYPILTPDIFLTANAKTYQSLLQRNLPFRAQVTPEFIKKYKFRNVVITKS